MDTSLFLTDLSVLFAVLSIGTGYEITASMIGFLAGIAGIAKRQSSTSKVAIVLGVIGSGVCAVVLTIAIATYIWFGQTVSIHTVLFPRFEAQP